METQRRSWMKAITWQIVGLVTTMIISYVYTGDWASSAGLSFILAAMGMVMYTLHERVWARIQWGRARA